MRTRIALVAVVPIAVITISTLTSAAIEQSARAATPSTSTASDRPTSAMPGNQLIAYWGITSSAPVPTRPTSLFKANGALSSFVAIGATAPVATAVLPSAPVVPVIVIPAPVVTPVDTVTPDQRAAWERVAMCEEGGNWAADGPRFSGGLGITRTNWYAFGGDAFAPSGAQATEDQQIMVAERIQSSPPDQQGCHSW